MWVNQHIQCCNLEMVPRLFQWGRSNVKLGGGDIFTYSCSHTVKTKDVFPLWKEISNVEHEYINIALQPFKAAHRHCF